MISNRQINECKSKLKIRQNQLIKQLNNHFGMEMSEKESTGELSSYDNHPADSGTELFERGKDLALNEHAENELEEINVALHAIDEGTYGVCSVCSKHISAERLLAIPTTDRCIDHAKNKNISRSRPIEEDVFSANINPDEQTEETQVGYDAEDAWQDVSRYGTSETPSDFYGDRESYNNMYPNSDEFVGEVEEVERTVTSNIHGYQTGYVQTDDLTDEEE